MSFSEEKVHPAWSTGRAEAAGISKGTACRLGWSFQRGRTGGLVDRSSAPAARQSSGNLKRGTLFLKLDGIRPLRLPEPQPSALLRTAATGRHAARRALIEEEAAAP